MKKNGDDKDSADWIAYLDGIQVKYCREADTERGYVEELILPVNPGKPVQRRRHGCVELVNTKTGEVIR